jgi:aspartate aminotransferase-like enzyme
MSPMFTPGPVDIAPEVLAAQARPMMLPRSPEFIEIFQRCNEKLKHLLFGDQAVFILPGGEFGMQEAAVRNFAPQRLLCCVSGYASRRWADVACANGRPVDLLEVSNGEAISPKKLAERLAEKSYDAVTLAHTETSTGVANPVAELARVIRETSPDTLLLLDVAAALGGVELPLIEWGVDFALASSEMCMALPPGLGLAAASERAMARAAGVNDRGWYFDLVQYQRHLLREAVPVMPAVGLIYALDAQLTRIQLEGVSERFTRHTQMAQRVWEWAQQREMEILADPGFRAVPLTVIQNRQGIPVEDLNRFLQARGMQVANGMGPFKDKYFIIATMGEVQPVDLEALLSALDDIFGD